MAELFAELFHSCVQCHFWRPRCLAFAKNDKNSITRLIFPQNLSQSLTLWQLSGSRCVCNSFEISNRKLTKWKHVNFEKNKTKTNSHSSPQKEVDTHGGCCCMLGNMQKAHFAKLQWKHFCIYGSHCTASSKRHMTRRAMCGWRGRLRYFQLLEMAEDAEKQKQQKKNAAIY